MAQFQIINQKKPNSANQQSKMQTQPDPMINRANPSRASSQVSPA
jgi:hypothetical protein